MKKVITAVRVTELGDVANRLAILYKKTASLQDDAFLQKIFDTIEKQGNAITEAVKRDGVYSQLDEVDADRDKAIKALAKLLDGYRYIPIESLKQHGEKLYTIFSKYGIKITEENYSSQSNLIDSLLQDYAAESVLTSIAALSGVQEAIENIRTSQNNFATIRAEYEALLATKKNLASASSLRKPLLDVINKQLIPYLVAMNIANKAKYGKFIANASEIVESINEVVKARLKKTTEK